MKVSVIISTYNSEEWLRKVLTGYTVQTEKDFQVVIADDGSNEKTAAVIRSFDNQFKYKPVHVWHEDLGFRKCKILNLALQMASSDYIIFTDGDCIPRNDFVAQHLKEKEEGYFLSGGYFKLSMPLSDTISTQDIVSQNCFRLFWLKSKGLPMSFKCTKLIRNRLFSLFMNWITPTKRSWNGHNSSAFKKDLLEINGFNELLSYGGEDRELGERLFNLGLLSKQIRYTAVCLHLDHTRNYVDPEKIKFNDNVRAHNKKNNITWISTGIQKDSN